MRVILCLSWHMVHQATCRSADLHVLWILPLCCIVYDRDAHYLFLNHLCLTSSFNYLISFSSSLCIQYDHLRLSLHSINSVFSYVYSIPCYFMLLYLNSSPRSAVSFYNSFCSFILSSFSSCFITFTFLLIYSLKENIHVQATSIPWFMFLPDLTWLFHIHTWLSA